MKPRPSTLWLLFAPALAGAQEPPAPRPVTLQAFVEGALKGNQEALAQRCNVTSAEAQISINRLMPDPTLTTGVSSRELVGASRPTNPTQVMVGLAWTLETGGKRAARVSLANEGVGKARADLDTFLGDLRLASENAFVDALRARLVLERKRKTLEGFQEVVRLNEIRFATGDIGGVELAQSRVEARRFEGEVFAAQADLTGAESALAQLLGDAGSPVAPAGSLDLAPVAIRPEQVMARALLNRVDLVAARQAVQLAESQKRLARANRWVDLGLSVGVNHTPPVHPTGLDATGSPFPAPATMSNSFSATLSIPLPFSRHQRGELVQAEAARAQARLEMQAMEQKTRADVAAAVAQYEASASQLETFRKGILQDTDRVLEGIQFSYKHGSSTLLEFIEAQRTSNEVHLAFLDAQAGHAKALATLDRLSGSHLLLAPEG
jgi:cobalt-zinc-cadmium efflux system outer membrane protein